MKLSSPFVIVALLASISADAEPLGHAARARLVWDRLVGAYQQSDAPKLSLMTELMKIGKQVEAADIAVRERRFIDVTIPEMVTSWTNQAQSNAFAYNGMVALVQGVVRDGIMEQNGEGDFRRTFFGNFQYRIRANAAANVPALDIKNELHFDAMVGLGLSPNDVLEIQRPQWTGSAGKAAYSGIMTVGAAKFLYDAGTNRRPVDWLFRTALCLEMNQVHDTTRGDRWVRQDVDRTDIQAYNTKCVGCHGTALDAMSPAFGFIDTTMNGGLKYIVFYNAAMAAKFTRNSQVFPDGYDTTTSGDRWENRATANQNLAIGWRGPTEGNGIPALTEMFVNSEQFSRCMAERVWNTVCLRAPTDNERAGVLKRLATEAFEQKDYRLHELFKAISITDQCAGPGPG